MPIHAPAASPTAASAPRRPRSLLFQVDYPEIEDGRKPRHRFMSAYEQRREPTDRNYQYVLFHADPYETVAFKVPSTEVDKGIREGERYFAHWDPDTRVYSLQITFKRLERRGGVQLLPPGMAPPPPPMGLPPVPAVAGGGMLPPPPPMGAPGGGMPFMGAIPPPPPM